MRISKTRSGFTLIEGFGAFAVIGIFLLWIVAIIGWIANVVQVIVACSALATWNAMTPFLVLKIVGIFAAPLGAILGWVGLF